MICRKTSDDLENIMVGIKELRADVRQNQNPRKNLKSTRHNHKFLDVETFSLETSKISRKSQNNFENFH